jgi:poly(A) polymerase
MNKMTYLDMNICLNNPIFKIISDIITKSRQECFVIGGYVRDCLLERDSKDIDIVVLGSGIELAKEVAAKIGKRTRVSVFKNFGTAMLKYNDYEIEFVGARKESYRKSSRKPVVEDGTLEDDQRRRDFTINALALSLNKDTYGMLVDPFGGLSDLNNKIIRTPLDPDKTYSDDPLRILRAIRLASQLNFNIEKNSLSAIHKNRSRISIISQERITDELNKIILSPNPYKAFVLLEKTGVLALIFPELDQMKGVEIKDGKTYKDIFRHSIKVLDNISKKTDNLWLRWSALLHDIGKPSTKRYSPDQGWTFHSHEFVGEKMISDIFRKFKLPTGWQMKYVQKLVNLHHRPIVLALEEVTDSAVRRLLYDAGDDIDDLMTLCEADITSKIGERVQMYMKNFRLVRKKLKEIEEKDAIRKFQPPISGELIMQIFNMQPCKEVGIIKNAIKDAILDGEIKNNYDEAYQYMLKKAKEIGLKPAK